MQPTRQDLISRSEVRKMIEKKIEYCHWADIVSIYENLLSELDNLPGKEKAISTQDHNAIKNFIEKIWELGIGNPYSGQVGGDLDTFFRLLLEDIRKYKDAHDELSI